MVPLVFEEHSYEENELEITGVYIACAVTCHEKAPGRRRYFIGRWYHRNKWCWIKRHICLTDVNDHILHRHGDMHSNFIDKEHKSCLNTDEDNQSHLDTVPDQRSMGHDPFF